MAEEDALILVVLAPNWFKDYDVDPDQYMVSLRQHLKTLYPRMPLQIKMGPEMPNIAHVEVKGTDEIDEEDVLGEVSDHFDEYE